MSLLVWVLIFLGGLLALAGLAFVAMLAWLLLIVDKENHINEE